jgi:hypothetical protein
MFGRRTRSNRLCHGTEYACPVIRNARVVKDCTGLAQRFQHRALLFEPQGTAGTKRGRTALFDRLEYFDNLDLGYTALGEQKCRMTRSSQCAFLMNDGNQQT